ncbi:MAG: DUF2961 domain-containing protein [Verrucomicrobia bacterium]|nr:MAG: DUF2961 domain-containing protein [Verrucomicrobiota bacterium]
MKRILLYLTASLLLPSFACIASQTLSYVDLVHRLTDLEYLATLPSPGDTCAQWSSYDRKSRYDAATGKYIDWDANGDGEGYIRKEGDKFVMAEMQGPGCIWRIWSAAPKDGHVRIYLDGVAEPAVDLPFIGYFDGKNAPFTRSAIVHNVGTGWNNYTPIPYQKSCKIVADAGWGLYFHFGYETFPKDTTVPTFKRELNAEEAGALDAANSILAHCNSTANGATDTKRMSLNPEQPLQMALKGPRAITRLRVKLDSSPLASELTALRQLAIQIKWDNESEPAVWAPLCDFFGTASVNNYRSLPLSHTGDEWWSSAWYMPFAKEAHIELINDGKAECSAVLEVTHAPLSRPIERLARFHAKWHRDAFLPKEAERWIDWPIVKTEGAGRFVGVMLHIWNPRGGWWGEGDEKFFVDGEKFPSTFGTGSEDYFGYAWGNPGLFENAYHNQTHNDGNNRGHICVDRWHISDNVPFQKSFEGCIEKYFNNQRPTLYAATAYWYLSAGGKDPYQPVPLSERVGYWKPVQTFKISGAIEGEKLKILSKTGGTTQEQDMTGFDGQWSNDAHLWWTEAKPGDKLTLSLPVIKSGTYRISMQLTKAPDYGIVQLYLDDQKLGETIDLYHQSVVTTGALSMGTQKLEAGDHKLTAEILGANAKAIKGYMFGLDYVKLEQE